MNTTIYEIRIVCAAIVVYVTIGFIGIGVSSEPFADWWSRDDPLGGKAATVAAVSSVLGGVAAAAAFESLANRRVRNQRAGLLYEASSQISSARAGLIAVLLASAGRDELDEWSYRDPYALNQLKRMYWQNRGHVDALVIDKIDPYVDEIHGVINAFPGLRDDFELVRTVHQAKWALFHWREWVKLTPRIAELSPQQRRDLLFAAQTSVDSLFQMLLVCEQRTSPHLRHRISEADANAYERLVDERTEGILGVTSEHAR